MRPMTDAPETLSPWKRRMATWKARAADWSRRVLGWCETRLPPGTRWIAGLLLMVGGVFGFLPILGFWMLPVGAMVLWLDVGPVWRRLRGERTDD